MTQDLFGEQPPDQTVEHLLDGAVVLRQFALADADVLLEGIDRVTSEAPFRHMRTPGGHAMSAAMSCCGQLGWVTDSRGYRYQSEDPESAPHPGATGPW